MSSTTVSAVPYAPKENAPRLKVPQSAALNSLHAELIWYAFCAANAGGGEGKRNTVHRESAGGSTAVRAAPGEMPSSPGATSTTPHSTRMAHAARTKAALEENMIPCTS